MARTKHCSRPAPTQALPNSVALGAGATELTLQPVPPPRVAKAGAARSRRGESARGRGLSVQVDSGDGSTAGAGPLPKKQPALVGLSSSGGPLSPTMAVVAAVRAWQASPPTGGLLIRPPEGSPRSDRVMVRADPLLAAEHSCTACGEVKPRLSLQRHPTLPVATCEGCVRYFLSDGQPDQWARYSNGKERYCSWCAHNDQCHEEGRGVIVECAKEGCPKIFCAACITRNFGDRHFQEAKKNKAWQCYSCDPERLQTLPSHELVAAGEPAAGHSVSVGRARSPMAQFLIDWLAKNPECIVDGKVHAPCMAVKESLASECGVPTTKVSEWFWDQNRNRKKGKRSIIQTLQIEQATAAVDTAGRCSACGTCAALVSHDLLDVKVCRSCFSSLHGLATCTAKDRPSGADISCRWCAKSSVPTVSCSDINCPSGGHGYCEHCITRNFSYATWKAVSQSYALGQWSCYACQPSPLRLLPRLGARISVDFEGEGTSIGQIVGLDGPDMSPGQLRVQFDPPDSQPWVIDPAAGHLFEVLPGGAAPSPRASPKASPKGSAAVGVADSAVAAAAASPSAVAASERAIWTDEMRQRLLALVEKEGTGDWQRKTEQLGYGHTAKQLSNKWRTILLAAGDGGLPINVPPTAAHKSAAASPRTAQAAPTSAPKATKPRNPKKTVPAVTVIYKGDSYEIPLSEAASASARGDRLEAKIRSVLQIVPGQRFVLAGAKGKLSFSTATTHPGHTFAVQMVDKRRRGGKGQPEDLPPTVLLSGAASKESEGPQHLVSPKKPRPTGKTTLSDKVAAALLNQQGGAAAAIGAAAAAIAAAATPAPKKKRAAEAAGSAPAPKKAKMTKKSAGTPAPVRVVSKKEAKKTAEELKQAAKEAAKAAKKAAARAAASAWIKSLEVGSCVDACDYRGEWHEGKIVDLQRFQVRTLTQHAVQHTHNTSSDPLAILWPLAHSQQSAVLLWCYC